MEIQEGKFSMTTYQKNAKIFKAFCDPNRLLIIDQLRDGEQCAAALLEVLQIGQPTLSHHMKILVEAGVVRAWKEGKWMHYALDGEGVTQVHLLLDEITALSRAASRQD